MLKYLSRYFMLNSSSSSSISTAPLSRCFSASSNQCDWLEQKRSLVSAEEVLQYYVNTEKPTSVK